MDLEKFFDRVNHDILMYQGCPQDRRTSGFWASSGVICKPESWKAALSVATDKGTPQGGPLSPLVVEYHA